VYVTSPDFSSTVNTWGTALSAFWLLPGPSRIYARIGVAVLGAFAVYNVYIIVRTYSSQDAVLFAVAPLIFYPSFIFIHSAVLREAAILVGLTTATRFLVAPSPRLSSLANYSLTAFFLWFATVLRPDNIPVYAAVLAIAATLKYRRLVLRTSVRRLLPPVIAAGVVAGTIVARPRIREAIVRLADIRRARARGRTEYLGWVFPESIPDAIAFSWIGASYFLFTPFPWMVSEITGLVALFEALGNVVFAVAAVFGVRTLARRNLTIAASLASGVVLGVFFYGLGTGNVGTAIRHRQMVLWAIFILGGIGLAERFELQADLGTEPKTISTDAQGTDD
jgi:hypothetical protein